MSVAKMPFLFYHKIMPKKKWYRKREDNRFFAILFIVLALVLIIVHFGMGGS